MNKIRNILLAGLFTSAATSQGAILAGQSIGIDFNGSTGTTGTNFNAFSADTNDGDTESLLSLIELAGGTAVTGVTFSLTNNSGQDTTRADFTTQGTEGTLSGSLSELAVWDDAYISNNQQNTNPLDAGGFFTLTFSGLDDSLTYDLTGGFDNDNANFDATWAADGQSFLTTPTGAAGSGYGTLTGLTTDGSGNLDITVTRNTLHLTVGGLELTAVPEPSSLAFLGLGALGLVGRRRR